MNSDSEAFLTSYSGFCPDCGSVLPYITEVDGVTCYSCKRKWDHTTFKNMSSSFVLHFNSIMSHKDEKEVDKSKAEGPVVERKCPACGNDKMSYATLQLRSADEGQTVFYTCTKCKYKETENS